MSIVLHDVPAVRSLFSYKAYSLPGPRVRMGLCELGGAADWLWCFEAR